MAEEVTKNISVLALPDEQQFRRDMQAINRFQQVVHATMVKDLDYGVIPGTQKPTLLKPGAEKIAKLLGLSDQYEIMDRNEDWQKPFFRYLIKCRLVHIAGNAVISEGLGECNSMESKYRWRWVGERDLPAGIDKPKLVSQERHSKTGGHWTVYRLDNEDIYSQVNTILKMAKKRALVDAALSAGRLSDVFTQDVEDMKEAIESEAEPMLKVKLASEVTTQIQETVPPSGIIHNINVDDLTQQIKEVKWIKAWRSWLTNTFKVTVPQDMSLADALSLLSLEQAHQFAGKINELYETK